MAQTQQYWSEHLERIAAEGTSTQAYAQREGLSVSALYNWRSRLKARTPSVRSEDAGVAPGRRLVPVRICDRPQPSSSCTLTLAPGVQLELTELPPPEWLARVMAAQSASVR